MQLQVEQESVKRSGLQSELSLMMSECAQKKAKLDQVNDELILLRQSKKVIDEELQKLKAQRSVDDLQLKELQEQLEAEQYFSVSSIFLMIGIYLRDQDCPATSQFHHYFVDEKAILSHVCVNKIYASCKFD